MAFAFAFAMKVSASPKKISGEFSNGSSALHPPAKRKAADWGCPLLRRSSRHITARLNAKARQARDPLSRSRFRSKRSHEKFKSMAECADPFTRRPKASTGSMDLFVPEYVMLSINLPDYQLS